LTFFFAQRKIHTLRCQTHIERENYFFFSLFFSFLQKEKFFGFAHTIGKCCFVSLGYRCFEGKKNKLFGFFPPFSWFNFSLFFTKKEEEKKKKLNFFSQIRFLHIFVIPSFHNIAETSSSSHKKKNGKRKKTQNVFRFSAHQKGREAPPGYSEEGFLFVTFLFFLCFFQISFSKEKFS
jgi:hypothetical protein